MATTALRLFAPRGAWTALLLAAMLIPIARAHAQAGGTIEGRVTVQGSGRPLGGVQLTIAGSTRGGRTDESGRFRIAGAPAGTQQLRAQRIGFNSATRTVTVAPGATVTADLELREAALSLEAVVVTGTAAEVRKKEVGNATAAIDLQQLATVPVQNTQDIIGGRAPGVTVLGNSGQPGSGGTIRLRGNNSITQGNNPIIYVDGVRIFSENGPTALGARQNTLALNDIKAEDIERVEIVKGAAATTLYGTEASGGVIQIFTKRGSAGPPLWSLEVTGGANTMGAFGPKGDPSGIYLKRCRGDFLKDSQGNAWVDPTCPSNGSWFRTGPVQRYGVSVRGGGESLKYFLSGNYNDEQGVVRTGYSKDGGFRGNFSFEAAHNLAIQFNSSYNRKLLSWVPDGNNAAGLFLNAGRGSNGNYRGGKGEDCAGVTITCVTNAYVLEQVNTNDADHFISGVLVNWSPTTSFTHRLNAGFDYNQSDNKSMRPFAGLFTPKGQILTQNWNHTKLSLDYAGSLQNTFLTSLASTFSWGGQYFRDRERYTRVDGFDFSGPGDPTLASAARVTLGAADRPSVVNAGLFLQELVGWRDRLFITGGLRVDGNSAFGEDFGLQKYPKLSVAYVLSEEPFWPKSVLSTLKLRAALGESGKAPGAFDAVRTWDPVAGDDGKPGVTLAQAGNPKLGPERTRELEVGFDVGALDNRLALEVTGFRARTRDALIGVTYPPSSGFLRTQLENVGTLQNQGLELGFTAGVLRRAMLEWDARVNVTMLESKAIDIGGREIDTGNRTRVKEGYPVPSYFGVKVTNPDEFADPVLKQNEYLGAQYPTRIIGIGTTLRLMNRLTLDALGEFQGGNYLANWVGYQNANRNVWQPCYGVQAKLRQALGPDAKAGTVDDVPSALADVRAMDRARCAVDRTIQNADFFVEKADFFKLRTVSLAYDLPTRFIPRGRNATLVVAGRNLFRSTNYSGTDPEVQDALDAGGQLGRRDYYNLPPYRSVTASLRLNF